MPKAFGSLAGNLGIEGDIQDLGSGSWEVTSDQGSLYAAPGFAQFISSAAVPEGELPSDEAGAGLCPRMAPADGHLPADAGTGMVVERVEDPPRVFVAIKPVQPENLMAAYPNISVILGPNAQVLEASFRWYDLQVADMYALLPATTAWQEVSERRSFLQTTIPADFAEPGLPFAAERLIPVSSFRTPRLVWLVRNSTCNRSTFSKEPCNLKGRRKRSPCPHSFLP
jgi:hypothetical protein